MQLGGYALCIPPFSITTPSLLYQNDHHIAYLLSLASHCMETQNHSIVGSIKKLNSRFDGTFFFCLGGMREARAKAVPSQGSKARLEASMKDGLFPGKKEGHFRIILRFYKI